MIADFEHVASLPTDEFNRVPKVLLLLAPPETKAIPDDEELEGPKWTFFGLLPPKDDAEALRRSNVNADVNANFILALVVFALAKCFDC